MAGVWLGAAGCGGAEQDDLVRKTIGPAGGLVSSHDDVLTIVLQPGALQSEEEIEIFPSDEPPPSFGSAYRVRPDLVLRIDAEIIYRRVLPSDPETAMVGAIRFDDYGAQMGYWRLQPRLALDAEQQWVIASDDELSLYYGLVQAEPEDLPELPPSDDVDGSTSMEDDSTGTTGG
ncbi:MAG: hypothetical protein AAGF11_48990 [Myxococcota bacterium]